MLLLLYLNLYDLLTSLSVSLSQSVFLFFDCYMFEVFDEKKVSVFY